MSSPDDRIILTKSNLQAFIDGVKQKVATSVVDTLFPVGFVYVTSTAPENGGDPNDLFPGTHWTRLEDTYICLAGDNDTVDGPNATPHGSNTRSASEMPGHVHSLASTSSAGSASGHIARLLYDVNNENSLVSGCFSASSQSGSWYGYWYNPNNTGHVTLSVSVPAHNHSLPSFTEGNNTDVTNMSVRPKTLYKYFWERDA
jgi:hypothetical protein